jgi:hypothetical protein
MTKFKIRELLVFHEHYQFNCVLLTLLKYVSKIQNLITVSISAQSRILSHKVANISLSLSLPVSHLPRPWLVDLASLCRNETGAAITAHTRDRQQNRWSYSQGKRCKTKWALVSRPFATLLNIVWYKKGGNADSFQTATAPQTRASLQSRGKSIQNWSKFIYFYKNNPFKIS